MSYVTNTTQLSLFSTIRTTLLSNSTISKKMNKGDIYQFEPKPKSNTFKGFPYIVANIPGTSDEEFVNLKRSEQTKDFTVIMHLVLEKEAEDKYIDFANAIIKVFEGDKATYDALGYSDLSVKHIDAQPDIKNQKDIIRGVFEISLFGVVQR